MSQQQLKSDPWTNLNQIPWVGGNAYAVARAQADVFARAAFIIRARALLEEAMVAPPTPVCPFLIEIARSRLDKRMATTSTMTDATAFSVIMNKFWFIDFILCSKTTTAIIRATRLIHFCYYYGFTLLYFTLPYFIL